MWATGTVKYVVSWFEMRSVEGEVIKSGINFEKERGCSNKQLRKAWIDKASSVAAIYTKKLDVSYLRNSSTKLQLS